jgi:S1-C subfamily serine protease
MPSADNFKDRVRRATVRLPKWGGQGVLVPGGYILTAAHCITWDGPGYLLAGQFFMESVEMRDGRTFLANVDAADPSADIAALGPADGQAGLYEDQRAFDKFAYEAPAVPLYTRALEREESIPVHVFTHKGEWIVGTATGGCMRGSLWLSATVPIECGTSGGPVVDDDGLLVGLVSHSPEGHIGPDSGSEMPAPSMALPRWVLDRIMEEQPAQPPRPGGPKKPRGRPKK